MAKTRYLHISIFIAILIVSACQGPAKRDLGYAAVRPVSPATKGVTNGAIYQAGFDMRLFEDVKARRVGDILIVRLIENTNAKKSATTNIAKDTSNNISNPTLLGAQPTFSAPNFVPFKEAGSLNLSTKLDSQHEFDGSGSATQANALTGSLMVSVIEVLPNSNLVVRGEKRVTLNNGHEYIRLSGIIRQDDILSDNSILSTQVADATISYTGEGAMAKSNLMGWLSRFFISDIFPF